MQYGADDGYLARARSLVVRCETLAGRLVAWGDSSFAVAWPSDRVTDVVGLVIAIEDQELAPEPLWAVGLAMGDLDLLAADGSFGSLAWGETLLVAAGLSRAAHAGEVVVHDDVRSAHGGRLSVVGEKMSVRGHMRTWGWQLNSKHPWEDPMDADADGDRNTLPYIRPSAEVPTSKPSLGSLSIAVATVRRLAEVDGAGARDALADLRSRRANAEGSAPGERCKASLGLSMGLMFAGRFEDALLEALDALARGREADDPTAVAACMAVLAKLYDIAGSRESAVALRDVALGR